MIAQHSSPGFHVYTRSLNEFMLDCSMETYESNSRDMICVQRTIVSYDFGKIIQGGNGTRTYPVALYLSEVCIIFDLKVDCLGHSISLEFHP